MTSIFIVIYFLIGIGFEVLIEDSQPDIIKRYKILQALVLICLMIFWLPYIIINTCCPGRDIWFRKKTYDR